MPARSKYKLGLLRSVNYSCDFLRFICIYTIASWKSTRISTNFFIALWNASFWQSRLQIIRNKRYASWYSLHSQQCSSRKSNKQSCLSCFFRGVSHRFIKISDVNSDLGNSHYEMLEFPIDVSIVDPNLQRLRKVSSRDFTSKRFLIRIYVSFLKYQALIFLRICSTTIHTKFAIRTRT